MMTAGEIRVFRADSMPAALEQVRRELGREAVILRTRQLSRRSLTGQRPAGVEITAARDVAERELAEEDVPPRAAAHPLVADPATHDLAARLRAAELPEELVAGCLVHANLAPRADDGAVMAEVARFLALRIPVAPAAEAGQRAAVALVGPPGSGKTTTIAKLAARGRVEQHLSVGLVSLDGYRAGAAEQLKAYATILDIPFVAAHGWEQLDDALERLRGLDRILIDTASRDAVDPARLERLAGALAGRCALYLTLAADSRDSVLERALAHFARIDYRGLAVTRADLLVGRGPIAAIAARALAPLCYVTTGPLVGGDIEHADADRLARWILDSMPTAKAEPAGQSAGRLSPRAGQVANGAGGFAESADHLPNLGPFGEDFPCSSEGKIGVGPARAPILNKGARA